MIEFRVDGSATITLSGEIDIAAVSAIADEVAAALNDMPTELILRLRDVTFIDSTGLGAMVRARNACLAHDVPLFLEEPSAIVIRVLQLTGLDAVMTSRP